MPPVSGNHQENLTTTHRTSNPTTLKHAKRQLSSKIWSQEFDDLKSFKQAVTDWAIAMHFSTRAVKSDKYIST